jgi:hypothetical protein
MFEVMYVFAQRYYRDPHAPSKLTADTSAVSPWVGVQGFLAGLAFNILGLIAVAVFSSDENRPRRTGWAIGGVLTAAGLLLALV